MKDIDYIKDKIDVKMFTKLLMLESNLLYKRKGIEMTKIKLEIDELYIVCWFFDEGYEFKFH